MKHLILAALVAILTACGGGGEDPDDGHVPTPGPVNCQANPAICR